MNGEESRQVLVADDEEGIRFVLTQFLKQENCVVEAAVDGQDAIDKCEARSYDLYILDIKMPRVDGLGVLRRIRELYPEALVIMITAFGSQKMATEALHAGAYDYFTKPFELEELRVVLRRALEKQALMKQVQTLEKRLGEETAFHRFIGSCDKMQKVFSMVRRVSEHDVTVLITGESGVGKELVAGAIHELGSGAGKPFVKINCAAIPEPLLESELFGHERGAFTGAVASKPGKFEIADGGSILLDEIGEMPLSLQAKLLRVIQEKHIERVGDTRSRPINVRIMTATNRDLAEEVRNKNFREDLYFRINVVPIHVPPLRERHGDIPLLCEYFINKYTNRNGKKIIAISPEAMNMMEAYDWPGNVRELDNTIQRAMVMTSGSVIDAGSLPPNISRRIFDRPARVTPLMIEEHVGPMAPRIERLIEEEEKRMIQAALLRMKDRRQETADLLGISRKGLHNKMVKYGLSKSKDKDDE